MLVTHKRAFAVSLILGVSATYFLVQLLERHTQGAVVGVVVARDYLVQGTTLRSEHMNAVDWPAKSAPAGAYPSTESLLDRILREPMVPGEPFLPGKLWPKGSKGNLLDTISIGQRAMTVPVQEISGIAAEELVGASVDVLLASKDAQNQPFSRIILENVLVLSVPGTARSDSKGRATSINAVTLQLTPENAQRLNLARSIGTLSLSLRHYGDVQENLLPTVPHAQLLDTTDLSKQVVRAPAKAASSNTKTTSAMASEAKQSDQVSPVPKPAPAQGVEVIRGTRLVTAP